MAAARGAEDDLPANRYSPDIQLRQGIPGKRSALRGAVQLHKHGNRKKTVKWMRTNFIMLMVQVMDVVQANNALAEFSKSRDKADAKEGESGSVMNGSTPDGAVPDSCTHEELVEFVRYVVRPES